MSCCVGCCASLTCGLCTSAASTITKKSARLGYCGLFGLSLIVSWVLREIGTPLLKKISWINTSDTLSDEWFQAEAVLRVSLGNCLFFTILALLMIGIKDQNDRRDGWHHGGWVFKIVIWALLIFLMFFLPNSVTSVYGFISKFGAGFFLLVQVIILLDATHSWNDAWVAKDEHKWFVALLAVSVTCYIAAFTISGLLFIWFNPSGNDCGLNVFFLVMTMILALSFAIIALHPAVNGSLLPASVISVYCAYLCYTGLSAEPRDYACNGLNSSKPLPQVHLSLACLQLFYRFYIQPFVPVLQQHSYPLHHLQEQAKDHLSSSRKNWKQAKVRRSGIKTCKLFIHLFPSDICIGKHVFGHAFVWMEQFRELRAHRRRVDFGLGSDQHRVGHCWALYLVTVGSTRLP
ncbi:hypothetical protein E3N88_42454 [Mikania micrantha]|uniref:Serine incorporator n=1 Tax=Mikania micrantha TaxID=192012 RepID=A0A5N6LHU9_9ASTR|nr:hypothetical protein E3N88_42454 [Mikania micrantha]